MFSLLKLVPPSGFLLFNIRNITDVDPKGYECGISCLMIGSDHFFPITSSAQKVEVFAEKKPADTPDQLKHRLSAVKGSPSSEDLAAKQASAAERREVGLLFCLRVSP